MLGKLYLLNALVTPVESRKTCVAVIRRGVPLEVVRKVVQKAVKEGMEIVSAVGHESTAKVMSQLLGIDVKVNRITITLQPYDTAIVFTSSVRLPEGKILSEEEIKQMMDKFEWSIIEVTACFTGTL